MKREIYLPVPRICADNSSSVSPRCTDAESLEVDVSTISGPTPLVVQEMASAFGNDERIALWLASLATAGLHAQLVRRLSGLVILVLGGVALNM